jgi:hypothetical protein
MSDQKRDWLKVSQTIASWVMVAIVLVGPPTLRELYDRGYALWMRWVVVLIVLAAAAGLVFRLRSRLWGLAKWAGGKLRAGYLWVLWTLVVRPARDHLGLVVSDEGEERKEEQFDAVLRPALQQLSKDALQVLEVILHEYHPTADRTVALRPAFVALEPWTLKGKDRRVTLACDELKMRGLLAGFESYIGSYGDKTVVTLARGLPDGLVLTMQEWVVDQLLANGIPPLRFRELPVPPPPEGSSPK